MVEDPPTAFIYILSIREISYSASPFQTGLPVWALTGKRIDSKDRAVYTGGPVRPLRTDIESDMKDLSLRDILRYFIAGGAFLAVLSILHNYPGFPNLKPEGLGDVSFLLGASALVGSIIYSVHRGVIYPFIFKRQIGKNRFKQCGPARWGFASIETEVMWSKARWMDTERSNRVSGLNEWANQIHLLYTVSEATVLAILVELLLRGCLAGGCTQWDPVVFSFLIFASTIFSAAYFSQSRCLHFEADLMCLLAGGRRDEGPASACSEVVAAEMQAGS